MRKPPPTPAAELAPTPDQAAERAPEPRAGEREASAAAIIRPVERSGRGHVSVPIRLRLRAQDLAAELERALEALAAGLGRTLARSAETLAEHHPGAVPVLSAPSFTWVGAGVADVPAALRQTLEQRLAGVIEREAERTLQTLGTRRMDRIGRHRDPETHAADVWHSAPVVLGSRPGVGSLGLDLEDSRRGVGALDLELKDSAAQQPAAGPEQEQENDPFRVARGQLTFNAEGHEGGRFHSRTAHWPGGASGVTIGRGYDLGHHSPNEIVTDMTESGISAGDAERFAGAAGITGQAARDWLAANRDSLPEITPEQQAALFERTYATLAGDVERISNNYARIVGEREGRDHAELQIDWNTVHPAIRDVLVDLRYRGDYTPTTRQRVQPPAIANDLRALYEVMRDRDYWMGQRGVPADRFDRRVGLLESALNTGGQEDPASQAPAQEQGPGTQAARSDGLEAPASGSPAAFTVTASSLNVRSAPDASDSNNRVGSLQRGAQVTGTPAGNGWVQIDFQGRQAFVSAQFLAPAQAGAGPEAQEPAQEPVGSGQRSGAAWVQIANTSGWVNSNDFSALDASWGPRAQAFVDGLRAAGATVQITAGLRHPNRTFLMHYAWGVAHGQYTPAQANAACQGQGIDIQWDHGDLNASRTAARELVSAFGLVRQASITSNHVRGLAIDMKISNLPGSITMNGKSYTTQQGASLQAAAASAAPIGRAMGVIWFGSGDWVHWSHDGR